MTTNAPALALDDITCRFAAREGGEAYTAVANATLTVGVGEFVSVVGPTGCGKSTLLNVAAGLLAPSSGTILVFGGSSDSLPITVVDAYAQNILLQKILIALSRHLFDDGAQQEVPRIVIAPALTRRKCHGLILEEFNHVGNRHVLPKHLVILRHFRKTFDAGRVREQVFDGELVAVHGIAWNVFADPVLHR